MLTPWPAIARPPGLSPLQEPGAGGGAGGAAAAPEGGHPGDGRAAHLAPAPAQAARAGRQAGLLGTAPAARGQAAGRPCRCAGHECVWVRWEGQGRQQQHAAATQLPAATNSAHSPLPPCSLGVAGGPAADGAELPHPGAAAVERAARLLQLAAGRAHRLSGLRAGGAQAVPLLQLQQLLAFATISMCWRICSIAAQHLTLHPAAALVVLQELAAAMQNREDLRPAVCSALVRLCLQARQVSWRAGGGGNRGASLRPPMLEATAAVLEEAGGAQTSMRLLSPLLQVLEEAGRTDLIGFAAPVVGSLGGEAGGGDQEDDDDEPIAGEQAWRPTGTGAPAAQDGPARQPGTGMQPRRVVHRTVGTAQSHYATRRRTRSDAPRLPLRRCRGAPWVGAAGQRAGALHGAGGGRQRGRAAPVQPQLAAPAVQAVPGQQPRGQGGDRRRHCRIHIHQRARCPPTPPPALPGTQLPAALLRLPHASRAHAPPPPPPGTGTQPSSTCDATSSLSSCRAPQAPVSHAPPPNPMQAW